MPEQVFYPTGSPSPRQLAGIMAQHKLEQAKRAYDGLVAAALEAARPHAELELRARIADQLDTLADLNGDDPDLYHGIELAAKFVRDGA